MKPFYIADIPIDPPIALAPMEGVTDRPFRALVRSLGGCGLTVTEFISSEAMTRDVHSAWRMAEIDPSEHPVSIQIYGRDPERMAQAAKHCVDAGADIVDINLGCPSKRVTSGCAGSALMREPERAREIFRAVRAAIDIPMTVKMRLGWDEQLLNAPDIARAAVEEGAQMIAVHGRTKKQGYKGHARWDEVRRVRDVIDVPLMINGDILDIESAEQALAQSGADGIMMGRAVMHDPWALARIAAHWRGEQIDEPSYELRRDLLLAFLDDLQHFDRRALVRLKKVIGYFSKGLPHARVLRSTIHHAENADHARAMVIEFFEEIITRARGEDDARPLTAPLNRPDAPSF